MAPTNPDEFSESVAATLMGGVVQFGTQVDVPPERVTSISKGCLDLTERRAQFSTQTVMDSQPQGDPVPGFFEDGVLSFATSDSEGSTVWINTNVGSIAELGLFPLLWSRGSKAEGDGFILDQESMTTGMEDNLARLVEESLDLLGWRSPTVRLRGNFKIIDNWWWSRVWVMGHAPSHQATVLTTAMMEAPSGVTIAAPKEARDKPVVTPEVVVRLLAHDWPDDLSWRS